MNTLRNKLLLGTTLALLLIGIPAVIFLSQQRQETRSRASASTTLAYSPASSNTSPIQKNIGENVTFDVMVDPGTNSVSFVKLELLYDATKFDPLTTNPFVVNTNAFPQTLEGPLNGTGSTLISLSVGNDPTRAITTLTKVGSLTLRAKAITSTPSSLTFGSRSQVLSVAGSNQATENVLSSTQPAFVSINTIPTITPTPTRIPTPTPTTIPPTPTPTIQACGGANQICCSTNPLCQTGLSCQPETTGGSGEFCRPVATIPPPTSTPITTPTPTNIPTATPTPSATTLALDILLHSIGNSGDNANPQIHALSNKNPLNRTRNIFVELFDSTNTIVASKNTSVTYDSGTGSFKGVVDFGSTIPSSGAYIVKVKSPTHLRRLIPGTLAINIGTLNAIPQVALVTGDTNNDNALNILDYNTLISCYSDFLPATFCTSSQKLSTDFNDDGGVNQFDYNIFLREISVQNGQ